MKPERFRNPWPHAAHRVIDILRWKLGFNPKELSAIPDAPNTPAACATISAHNIAVPPTRGWRIVWLGHASFLIQGAGVSLLIDPIFSAYCFPVPFPSLKRWVAPPCEISDLPKIDAILLTHSHYDHLDLPSLRAIGNEIPIFIAEGHAPWLKRKGFNQVTEIPWHQSHEIIPGLSITATPAQHFTARSPWDRDQGHWCGWLINGASCKLWHAGDTGYCSGFQEIGQRYGPLDFGMIPIGAYHPQSIMRSIHLNPEEAIRVFEETQCKQAVAMHWGTFQLTDEPLGEPPLRLQAGLKKHAIREDSFVAGHIGQMWMVSACVTSQT